MADWELIRDVIFLMGTNPPLPFVQKPPTAAINHRLQSAEAFVTDRLQCVKCPHAHVGWGSPPCAPSVAIAIPNDGFNRVC